MKPGESVALVKKVYGTEGVKKVAHEKTLA